MMNTRGKAPREIGSYILIGIFFGVLLTNCDSPPEPDSQEIEETVEKIIPTGNEEYFENNSDYIFDQNTLHTFELTLPEANLRKINADPSAEEYVEGSLTFQGETISPVGIRYKGSIGAFVGCLSGSDWTNPSGHKTCTKLSMKIKINWEDTNNTFYGLKKLQFHSMNLDPTQMRERLGYWLFREMGVPAPRSVHARLVINGIYSGIYALTEQIDGRFARNNFSDGTGNMYKEVWPLNMDGRAYPDNVYLDHLVTNEDENPSAEMIRKFGQDVSVANSSELQDVILEWMELDKIMAYAVVDRTIRNDDGPFHWYCGSGGHCSNHNYFWYEEPTENKLYLIPWDLDNALENLTDNVNPVTPIADAWGEVSNDCKPFNYGLFQGLQRSAACDKLTAGWVSFEDEYNQTLVQFMQGPFSEGQVNAKLNSWIEQIRGATNEAGQTHNDALTSSDWLSAVNDLKVDLEAVRR